MSLAPGTTIAHFEVLATIGRGGMGEVYRARDTRLGREVAIKVLPDAVTFDADRFARFQREARILASLNEPGILTLHSIEDIGLRCFIVTELVEGRELSKVVPEQGLPFDVFLDLAKQLVRAIAAAHRAGILHRDIKPANVMVTEAGRLKVLDFGLAKVVGGDEAPEGETVGMTGTGVVMGTVPYMSPEQLQGKTVDTRSDLFSLGIVLYEMICGERPFAGATGAELASSILRDEPLPLPTRLGRLPQRFHEILRRCLAKDPAGRYPTANELLRDLEAVPEDSAASIPLDSTLYAPPVATQHVPSVERGRSSRAAAAPSPMEQHIRYCTTADGLSVAYATVGEGPPLVRALGWFTHLEKEWQWPAARRFWERFARKHRLIRYDGRGIGLSACEVDRFTLETRLEDLSAVVDAIGLDRFALMGMSEGGATAVAYAARHPDRVTHLILSGAFPKGKARGEAKERFDTLLGLMAAGWGERTPLFQNVFAQLHLGMSASPEALRYFNEMQRASAPPAIASRYYASNGELDVREEVAKVTTPTLIVHRRDDLCVPFEAGQWFARKIPGSRLVPLKGDNHWLLYDDEGAPELLDAIEDFLGTASVAP